MKQLPNILSCARIILSLALLFVLDQLSWFLILYLVCGLTDMTDGIIARRLKAETRVGAKLDSLGDFVFFSVALVRFIPLLGKENSLFLPLVIALVTVLRVNNLIITKVKFRQWGMIHTILNKITGLALFIALPVCLLTASLPLGLILPLGMIAILSAAEECIILLTAKTYDPNRKSLFAHEQCGK